MENKFHKIIICDQEAGVDVSAGTDNNVALSFPIDGDSFSREFGKMIRTYSDEIRLKIHLERE